MTDRLSALLSHFELRTRVFFSGAHCGVAAFPVEPGSGHLHLLRRGRLEVLLADGRWQVLDEPTLLFYPAATAHRLQTRERDTVELVCAVVDFGLRDGNPLLTRLPSPLIVPLRELPQQGRLLDLLFEEAFAGQCGQAAAVNRLMEVLLIHLLRHGMRSGLASAGTLAGLADARLAKALAALHGAPAEAWTLPRLAAAAGMSRARFAAHFHAVIGLTPGDYLAQWRVSVAQTLLRRGRPLGVVAQAVGYRSSAAFARVFARQLGLSPRQWLRQQAA
ncbi:MAG TPA: AraC family transcriptional regulator [Nevskiaceae bacterium]|nr:AraC family transcriptional regulator [Nevskiaceae bacterium]